MNLDSLLPGTIPDFSQCPRDDLMVLSLMKKIEHAKALGMYKVTESEFLLCYDREYESDCSGHHADATRRLPRWRRIRMLR